ncbi:hypothetical protein SEA_SURVIVORS_54 [Gordonia phage Survivors]|nr:hypothetical protein SEA_SURVIVORS_54 [Gordonia phage Survivors]
MLHFDIRLRRYHIRGTAYRRAGPGHRAIGASEPVSPQSDRNYKMK